MGQERPKDTRGVINFWQLAMLFGPLAVLALHLIVSTLSGGFDDFQWIGRPVTFVQAIGILGAISFPFGAFFFARRHWYRALSRASQDWPTVPGVVEQSETQRRVTGLPMVLWHMAITYSYRVSDRAYRGDAVQFGPRYVSAKELIFAMAAKYPAGSAVTVRYDPGDPGMSVIETSDELARQNGWQIWLSIALPFVLGAIAAIKNSLH